MARIYRLVTEQQYKRITELCTNIVEEDPNEKVNNVLKLISSAQRNRCERLLHALLATSNLTWNKSGEISLNRNVVSNSHIVDLVSFATKNFPVKNVDLNGLPEFLLAIKQSNVPRDLLSSQVKLMLKDKPILQWKTFSL